MAGTNIWYEWDAEDRLVAINKYVTNTATLQRSEFTYDGFDRWAQIVEKTNGIAGSTNRFVWCGSKPCQERDGGNNVQKRFFDEGEQIAGSNYYFVRDALGSVQAMVDADGFIRGQYEYDPYGQQTQVGQETQVAGDMSPDFGFAGYYQHAPSGLYLTVYRAYDSSSGRWLNRDPIGEDGGLNLYDYVGNSPVNFTDPLGIAEPLQPGDDRLPPFQPINPTTRDALRKYFQDNDPNNLKNIPNDELEKARDNASRACEKYRAQGRPRDKFYDLQNNRRKLLDDLLKQRSRPAPIPWWQEIPIPIFIPIFFDPNYLNDYQHGMA